MNPTLSKIIEQEDEFNYAWAEDDVPRLRVYAKSFHRQTIISLLEGEIARLENRKLIEAAFNSERLAYKQGYNMAIERQIAFYKETLEGIKRL